MAIDGVPRAIPVPDFVYAVLNFIWRCVGTIVLRVPGSTRVVEYVSGSYRDDPYRTAVEIGLILYGVVFYLSKPQKKKGGPQTRLPSLTAPEIEALIEDWEPESLVDASVTDKQRWRLDSIPVIVGSGIEKIVTVRKAGNLHHDVFNMSTTNFLQLSNTDEVLNVAKQTIKSYGVGSCGPAGFYGNQDVHFNLEYKLASFFGTESAVLYGQDFVVGSSVIPAFTKRGDIIVADDHISVGLQNALQLSRSTVYYFEHNNMESLESFLADLTDDLKNEKLPEIPRKFIVTEGLFHNTGDIAPLPELTRLKNKYKFRLAVDEIYSIGVLGKTGRGLPEHFGMDRASSVDLTIGSLATAFGSSGGFVLGDSVMSQHQRIGSNAYCFSASLPAYTTTCAVKVMEIMEQDNSAVTSLHNLSKRMYDFFASIPGLENRVLINSTEFSPVLHLELLPEYRLKKFDYTEEQLYDAMMQMKKKSKTVRYFEQYEKEEMFLQEIVDDLLVNDRILITRKTAVLRQEALPVVPSLKITCHSSMTDDELISACEKIKLVLIRHLD